MVLVDTTTRVLFCLANNAAGTRYANDFPTPVPASTIRWLPNESAFDTALSISTCSGRCSKDWKYCENGPPYSNTDAISSTSRGTGFSGFINGGNLESSNHVPTSFFLARFDWTPSFALAWSTSWNSQPASHSRGSLKRTISASSSSGNS